ncbi:murein biosynthesis integral membrane protein MurJ [Iningainema tapete]|uniref:Probable lipid II flippase MurJ n=1 Tax=Iningainema tapete BLCC-T55 TaxID=2748662 RepID=A0A8J7C012_9CYAN|nr:murein biosynthesis integral membrane protein MurJ [Iningainema tapete]MBD2777138.1 murein biosynthesis integral membrane protein MurJ [Iningainema tapete BLCC-T55]
MTQQKPSRSLAGIAGIVAAATLISKIVGLVRQQVQAAAFGLGAAADAFNFAYTIPGFLLILLGGINGPFYSAVVSVLAKRKKEEAAPLVETITTLIGGILLIVTIFLVIFAPYIIDLFAPGLKVPEKQLIREIAIQQLQIMAPMAVFSGLIGIGFGVLNAANQFWLPSISPLFSSVTVIIGLGILYLQLGSKISTPEYAMLGGAVLAGGYLAGAVLQWIVQVIAQTKAGFGRLRLRFDFNQPGVRDVMKIMLPATFSSGMLQINLYTDLFFASLIPVTGVAAALANASLLVQTPLGIISNVILVPLLPIFSRLAAPENWQELKFRIRQGLLLSAFTMLPLGALMITLAVPIVRVVYERGAFKVTDSALVASLLVANGIGMFVYLGRDVLVRVFYALGDGETPFRISMINIFLNAVLDYFLIKPFGAPGLVLATVLVNFSSVLMLLFLLNRKLNGLPLKEWMLPILGLAAASTVAGTVSFATLKGLVWLLGPDGLLIQLLELSVAGILSLLVFGAIAASMRLPEVDAFVSRLRQRFLPK